jgi:hypothetical protein
VKQAASTRPIELKITDLHQLFNSMDPSPFHERDLDHDAEEFIVSWARESPKEAPIRLVIHLAKPAEVPDPQSLVASSLRHYFEYRAEITLRELKQLLRQGRASLVIGLIFLVACNAIATLFAPGPGTWHGLAREGLAILGWVAMWHPLDLLLYRWWPVLRLKRLYQRLARAEVTVKTGP